MAWAALSAGSGDSPSICMIWFRWAMLIRVCGRRKSWCRGARPGGQHGDLAQPRARPRPNRRLARGVTCRGGGARSPRWHGGSGDLAGHFLDGGDGRLLVGGDQVQVAGVVVAFLAAGCAVGAWGADAGSPVGDRVFERLQVLEPARVNGPGVCCGSGVGVWIRGWCRGTSVLRWRGWLVAWGDSAGGAGCGHCVITAHTTLPLDRAGVCTPHSSLRVSTSRSPRPWAAPGAAGPAWAGLWWLPSQTAAMTRCWSEQSQTRTGGVPGDQRPSYRLPVRPADAWTAFVVSSLTIRGAVSSKSGRPHSQRTARAWSRAQGTALASGASSRYVRSGQWQAGPAPEPDFKGPGAPGPATVPVPLFMGEIISPSLGVVNRRIVLDKPRAAAVCCATGDRRYDGQRQQGEGAGRNDGQGRRAREGRRRPCERAAALCGGIKSAAGGGRSDAGSAC